jgi:hypothetical protein
MDQLNILLLNPLPLFFTLTQLDAVVINCTSPKDLGCGLSSGPSQWH